MAITRTAMIDDDGIGTTGTILNNAWKQELYGQIDAFVDPGVARAGRAVFAAKFTAGPPRWCGPSRRATCSRIGISSWATDVLLEWLHSGVTISGPAPSNLLRIKIPDGA